MPIIIEAISVRYVEMSAIRQADGQPNRNSSAISEFQWTGQIGFLEDNSKCFRAVNFNLGTDTCLATDQMPTNIAVMQVGSEQIA